MKSLYIKIEAEPIIQLFNTQTQNYAIQNHKNVDVFASLHPNFL
jgi:hypothetical protein